MSTSSSSTGTPATAPLVPIYDIDVLVRAEAEIERDPPVFLIKNRYDRLTRIPNTIRGYEPQTESYTEATLDGIKAGQLDELEETTSEKFPKNVVILRNETDYEEARRNGDEATFCPVTIKKVNVERSNLSVQEVQRIMELAREGMRQNGEEAALRIFVREHLADRAINKVIGFGLGTVSYLPFYHAPNTDYPYAETAPEEPHFRQHVAAMILAEELSAVSNTPVELFLQDPEYKKVDTEVLTNYGFCLVGPAGARGFALIDERSLVLSSCPGFPLRQVLADMPRPAAVVLNSTSSPDDPESSRSRRMMSEYSDEYLDVEPITSFVDSIWWVRKP
ncbi:hypothetical protein GGS20DRAFT_508461 [Poronia punctata]|nr:hypothetical protein GGS20DRAFT_508461 [Poronia punctata]